MLTYGDRQEIEEIITKYEFEPTLDKEIYVEGSSDKALVEWFLKRAGVKNITVLEISTVNIFIEKQKKSLPKDRRQIIHGHDFENLLQFYLGIKKNEKEKVFERSLYSALEYEMLKKEKLFQDLLEKL